MSRCATHLINRKDKPTFSRSTRVSKHVSSTSIKYRWLSLSPSPKNSIHLFKKKKDIISCIRTRVEDNFFSKLSNETFSLPHNRWPSFGPNRWAAAPFESHPWLTMFFLFLYTHIIPRKERVLQNSERTRRVHGSVSRAPINSPFHPYPTFFQTFPLRSSVHPVAEGHVHGQENDTRSRVHIFVPPRWETIYRGRTRRRNRLTTTYPPNKTTDEYLLARGTMLRR